MSQGPLWTASYSGHINIVNTLIGAGAKVNQGDKVGSHVSNILWGHLIIKTLNALLHSIRCTPCIAMQTMSPGLR